MTEFRETVAQFYDRKTRQAFLNRLLYEGSEFLNFGYWRADTATVHEACENLMEELLRRIPDKKGTILDAACGKGATTSHLCRYYDPSDVVGINISKQQLRKCRENAPGCTFLEMDATDMSFPDASFDNIICVEAAFHFNTRERFFGEALRVLKHGGRLVMADMLMPPDFPRQPVENVVAGLDEYEAICRRAGFVDVDVADVTEACVGGMYEHAGRLVRRRAPWLAARPSLAYSYVRDLERQWRDRSYILVACCKRGAKSPKAVRRRHAAA